MHHVYNTPGGLPGTTGSDSALELQALITLQGHRHGGGAGAPRCMRTDCGNYLLPARCRTHASKPNRGELWSRTSFRASLVMHRAVSRPVVHPMTKLRYGSRLALDRGFPLGKCRPVRLGPGHIRVSPRYTNISSLKHLPRSMGSPQSSPTSPTISCIAIGGGLFFPSEGADNCFRLYVGWLIGRRDTRPVHMKGEFRNCPRSNEHARFCKIQELFPIRSSPATRFGRLSEMYKPIHWRLPRELVHRQNENAARRSSGNHDQCFSVHMIDEQCGRSEVLSFTTVYALVPDFCYEHVMSCPVLSHRHVDPAPYSKEDTRYVSESYCCRSMCRL
nr:hypothetical protein CFP56_19601 [Quercus suber]